MVMVIFTITVTGSHSHGLTVMMLGTIMDMIKQRPTEEQKGRHRKLKLEKGNFSLQFLPRVKNLPFATLRPC